MRNNKYHVVLILIVSFSMFITLLFSTSSVIFGKQFFQAPDTDARIFLPIIFKNYPAILVFSNNGTIYSINLENGNLIDLGLGDHPSLSPDRTKIAFTTSNTSNSPCCTEQRQLRVMNTNGSNIIDLSSWTTRPIQHFWSPDGTKLAFMYGYDYPTGKLEETYTINNDGTNLQPLSDTDNFMSWSPAGMKLIVGSTRDGTTHIINSDGTGRQPLTSNSYPPIEWSPDGSKIAFQGFSSGLYIINSDGTDLQQFPQYHQLGSILWSPDGTRLAFVDNSIFWQPTLYIMKSDGTGLQLLTDLSIGSCLEWNPDGTMVAFRDEVDLYIMNSDGTSLQFLTDYDSICPRWSPDGTKLIFVDENKLHIINRDGTNKTLVYTPPPGKVINQHIWSPAGVKIIIVSNDPNLEFSNLDIVNPDGSNLLQVLDELQGNIEWLH